jgi:hypothetical protein
VLRHSINLGQGAVLQTGVCYALSRGAGYIYPAQEFHTPDRGPGRQERGIASGISPLWNPWQEIPKAYRISAAMPALPQLECVPP